MLAAVTMRCRDSNGEVLGELSVIDRRGRKTLIDDGEISLSELGEYVVRFVGARADQLSFTPPIEGLPTTNGDELLGLLARSPGLGVIRLEIKANDGQIKWRRLLSVRPEKLQDQRAFERMVGDLCRWRTALALDLHARSSAPWVWSEDNRSLIPEERLIVIRAAIEDNRLFDNLALIERASIMRLNRDVELVPLGEEEVDVYRLGFFVNGPGARTRLPTTHPLSSRIASLPSRLPPARKVEIADTPENQFVKVAINRFRQAALGALGELSYYSNSPLAAWAREAERRLNRLATSRFFSEISWPAQMVLGSPALQRRAGYRSILQAFLDLRAGFSLPWEQLGSAVFGETRDVPTIYEFWCLLRLREALETEFGALLDMEHFLLSTGRLTIRRGSVSHSRLPITLNGMHCAMALYYNRTFSPAAKESSGDFQEHDFSIGTWSKPMKPDFTVSLRPSGLSEEEAVEKKLLRLVHFDAKYRLKRLIAEGEATHLPDDVDKMHAYLAAINHSYGAYILFPGNTAELFAAPLSIKAVGAIPIAPDHIHTFPSTLRSILERAFVF
jgi:hypothetical protein